MSIAIRLSASLSDLELANAVELNTAVWIRPKGRLTWVQFHDEGDVEWMFAGDTYPQNTVILARFTPRDASQRVAEVLEPHLQHRATCNWILGPVSQPSELPSHLKANGLSCRIHCSGMACEQAELLEVWQVTRVGRAGMRQHLPQPKAFPRP